MSRSVVMVLAKCVRYHLGLRVQSVYNHVSTLHNPKSYYDRLILQPVAIHELDFTFTEIIFDQFLMILLISFEDEMLHWTTTPVVTGREEKRMHPGEANSPSEGTQTSCINCQIRVFLHLTVARNHVRSVLLLGELTGVSRILYFKIKVKYIHCPFQMMLLDRYPEIPLDQMYNSDFD